MSGEPSAAEPQFDVLAADELDAVEAGRAVLEAELDATVRVHPWLPPGQLVVFDRAKILDLHQKPPGPVHFEP